ncbi:hypothetical protein AJ80_00432 [Polytolypa hystricis UAMH7299]|uniref:Zn(2)-C6 fungal-type domain-containing protein n=1 Tax=Polytolypa hystricis (strain UAMH7299) TaxID=1447883 RepID=A0A2B7Z492_POLH7|nr:hypothetical protein AJ80_00432 [Polytolypa hystricis UAMH7299]
MDQAMTATEPDPLPRSKRQRVAAACDICRRRKFKCNGEQQECGPCRTRGNLNVKCTWNNSLFRASSSTSREDIVKLQERIKELEKDIESRSEQNAPHSTRLGDLDNTKEPLRTPSLDGTNAEPIPTSFITPAAGNQ